ncbi:fibronectin type III domain-containing protein [Colletotrichum tabaci]|uniref:Fibronectin type III domain-containing protein n=1 Tax=Colletotrichum tabaci TaxID=1209068 RepID=A0AAV9TCJ8_9PEZI
MGDLFEENDARSIRIMVVGDSMSQGHEGDFTWRYRLWQWLTQQKVDFRFVGPYKGTKTPEEPRPPQPPALLDEPPTENANVPIDLGGYAVGVRFDSRHFSVWGQQATRCQALVRDQVERFRPHYMLVMLGFNDMGWGVTDAEGTIAVMQQLIERARAAEPKLRFAIADVPQRVPVDGAEYLVPMVDRYNRLLRMSVKKWGTEESPIELAGVSDGYDCSRGSYDGLHPNALGEFQIARVFSQSLVRGYEIGTDELQIPREIPKRPTPVPANIVAKAVPYGIAVTWDSVYGALGYDVRSHADDGSPWDESRTAVSRFDSIWTEEGQEYQYQVRTYNGDHLTSAWSRVASAVAHPKTASGPRSIVTKPDAQQVAIQWEELPGQLGIGRYEVMLSDQSVPGSSPSSFGVKGTNTTVRDLTPSHKYGLSISTWTDDGGGIPTVARSFVAGRGKPPVPTQLRVETRNSNAVHLEWQGSDDAAGYIVWVRNRVEDLGFSEDGETESTDYGITFLILGAWNFEFCVSAYNGDLESERSSCVVPPRSDGSIGSAAVPLS